MTVVGTWPKGRNFRYRPTVIKIRKLIDKFGAKAVLRKQSKTGPANRPIFGEPEYHRVIVVDTNREVKLIDGVLYENFKRTAYLAPLEDGTVPESGDMILLENVDAWDKVEDKEVFHWMKIVEVRTSKPGDTILLHEMDLER